MLYFSVPLKGAVAFTPIFILYIDFRNYICVGDINYWRTILMLSLPNKLQSSVYAEVGTEREWFAIHCDDEESQQGGKRSFWRRCWTFSFLHRQVRTLQHLAVAAATPEGQLPFLHQSLLHFLDLHIKSEGPWLCWFSLKCACKNDCTLDSFGYDFQREGSR